MTAQLAPPPLFRATDGLGFPLFLGRLSTYQAGTLIPQATYVDSTQTTQNTNPVILNARGECNLWLDPTLTYKFALTDQFGNNIPGWPIDNIPGSAFATGISFSLIPNPTNTLTLGNSTHSWAQLFLGPNASPALGASGIIGYYPRTAAEIALTVTPTDFSYSADPYVDPRRYGADQTGIVDSTIPVQIGLNVALQANGALWIGNACKYLIGAVSLTIPSGRSVRILGSSLQGSILQAKTGLSATTILTLKATAPVTAPVESFSVLENFTIQGPVGGIVSGVNGLSTQGIAKLQFKGTRIAGFDRGWDAVNTLTCTADSNSEFTLNNIGMVFTLSGTVVTNNLLRIQNCQINLNAKQGISYNSGTGLYLSQCDMESNGTAGDPTTGAVFINGTCSPDLLEAHNVIERCWFEGNHGWTINLLNPLIANNQRTAIRGCEIIAPEAMNYGSTGFTATFAAGVMTVSAISAGTKIEVGMGLVSAGNLPSYPIPVVTGLGTGVGQTGTYNVSYTGTIGAGVVVTGSTNRAISAVGSQSVHLEDLQSGTAGDTYYLNCSEATLIDVFVSQLLDISTTPFYMDVSNAAIGGKPSNGRYDLFTGTLTGCTTTPTIPVQVIQQGNEITLMFTDLTATSNTTSCTITGLPTKYQITSGVNMFMPAVIRNNTADGTQMVSLDSASGTITLYQGGLSAGFTAAGTKGIRRQSLKYRLDL